jgi:hypothetical protein
LLVSEDGAGLVKLLDLIGNDRQSNRRSTDREEYRKENETEYGSHPCHLTIPVTADSFSHGLTLILSKNNHHEAHEENEEETTKIKTYKRKSGRDAFALRPCRLESGLVLEDLSAVLRG